MARTKGDPKKDAPKKDVARTKAAPKKAAPEGRRPRQESESPTAPKEGDGTQP